jgi:endonuclease/exonuclease/phosphatase family metal-dependent hydrolase
MTGPGRTAVSVFSLVLLAVIALPVDANEPGAASAYGGVVTLPGTIQAENFDNGGEGVAYHDTSAANAGGAYRQTAVDIEASTEGGYNVGWIDAGEWLNYTVNVATTGSYTVQLRVASVGGGSLRVGFNGSSPVWQSVPIPSTNGWQNWTSVSLPATLGSGEQQLTVYFETGSINFNSVTVVAGSVPSGGTATQISVVSWNVQNNDFSDAAAREEMARALTINPRPQVIAIQEGWIQFYNSYLDELQRRTGQTWYGAFQTLCPTGGWNGSSCTVSYDQGLAIFSAFPIVNTSAIYLPFADCWNSARAALRAAINVNGKIVQFFNTHLQTGCGDVLSSRYQSMTMIKDWARNYSTPQIVAGDFNADPDQILSTSGMAPNFNDSWPIAGVGNRHTYPASAPTMKLDYLLFDASGTARPIASETITGIGPVSDHLPVRTTFEVIVPSSGPPPPPPGSPPPPSTPPPTAPPVPTGLIAPTGLRVIGD